jgi:hypothetical protein
LNAYGWAACHPCLIKQLEGTASSTHEGSTARFEVDGQLVLLADRQVRVRR